MHRSTLRSAVALATLLSLPLLMPTPARAWWGPGGWHPPRPPVVVRHPVHVLPPIVVRPAPIHHPVWVPGHFDRFGDWVPGHWW
ncbi:MAG: hypothetical protein AAGC69_20545 [Paracraurococcus sp.]|jgi:hypothetical protein